MTNLTITQLVHSLLFYEKKQLSLFFDTRFENIYWAKKREKDGHIYLTSASDFLGNNYYSKFSITKTWQVPGRFPEKNCHEAFVKIPKIIKVGKNLRFYDYPGTSVPIYINSKNEIKIGKPTKSPCSRTIEPDYRLATNTEIEDPTIFNGWNNLEDFGYITLDDGIYIVTLSE